MAEIKVPELAESITEGTIAGWLKNVGDYVEKGEYIVELETDKVNIELNSDYAGKIIEQKFSEGETVKVGDTIAIIDESGESTGPAPENKQEELVTKSPKPGPNAVVQENVAAIQQAEKREEKPITSP